MKRVVLEPRPGSPPRDVEEVNAFLESRGDATRLDADQFVVDIANADIANQAQLTTGYAGEPLRSIVISVGTAGQLPYGAGLVSEIRRLCEELAERFDLVVIGPSGPREVAPFFDEGGL